GGERIIKLFGIGLGGAVLLDAAIVRSVLVPAVMLMLGDLNWKLPAFLDRILPRVNIEGSVERMPARDEHLHGPVPEPVSG
ncbi:MAG: MMPL family transporter, partial [Solirubrobacteraceae bacterium]